MSVKNLYLMCGAPGSGKTTWCKNAIKDKSSIHISRDVIRFALLDETDGYFDKETEVFDEFIREIREALKNNSIINIYVDATHLSEAARNKVLDRLNLTNVTLYAINFLTDIKIAIKRNELREGRSVVPRSVLRRMALTFQPAIAHGEKYNYNIINIITNENEEVLINDMANF